MMITCGKVRRNNAWHWHILIGGVLLLLQEQATLTLALEEGEGCRMQNIPGTCQEFSKCKILRDAYEQQTFTVKDAVHCSYNVNDELICCPIRWNAETTTDSNTQSRKNTTVTTAKPPQQRPAITVCERIQSKLGFAAFTHILDGIPADPGEFPHAAVILFNDENVRCGGSLIDARFVLTAAHCVKSARRQPVSVRLGLVNLTNTNEGIEIPIARVHLHPNYTGQFKYNDIALMELQRDAFDWETVNWNFIGPVCLYTDDFDPPRETKLNVVGWGIIDKKLRTTSPILMKVDLNITESKVCDAQFRNELVIESHSSLPNGIIDSQVCAYAAGKDACQGDSGGPLNLVMDIDMKFYKIFGIVSTGFICGSSTPGLYTRVSSYIEYIESVVWPNSK